MDNLKKGVLLVEKVRLLCGCGCKQSNSRKWLPKQEWASAEQARYKTQPIEMKWNEMTDTRGRDIQENT